MSRLLARTPGPQVLVQDPKPRRGRGLGFPPGGPLDPWLARALNRVLGNDEESPLLEWFGVGGRFLAEGDLTLAVAGAPVWVEARAVAEGFPVVVPSGAEVSLGAPRGQAAWLALGGGIRAPCWQGAASVDERLGLGRRLLPGDVLELGPTPATVPGFFVRPPAPPAELRVLPGPEWCVACDALFGVWWFSGGDRRGRRLAGRAAPILPEIPSAPLVPGVVELPPGGEPVVLLADGPVTGGYPRVLVLPPEELRKVPHLPDGHPFTLTICDGRDGLR